LRPDGTYAILEEAGRLGIDVEFLDPFLRHHAGEYGQNSMQFMPIIRNTGDKTITGFKFTSTFKSAFGDEIFSFSGESSERIGAGRTSTANTYYYFEDNQFIGGQPYDKLKIFEAAGTGTVTTEIDAVVFADGQVLKRGP